MDVGDIFGATFKLVLLLHTHFYPDIVNDS